MLSSDKSLGSASATQTSVLPLFVKGSWPQPGPASCELGFYFGNFFFSSAHRPRPQALPAGTTTLHSPQAFLGDLSPPLPNWEFDPIGNLGLSLTLARIFYRRRFWSFAPPMALFSSHHPSVTAQCTAVHCLLARSAVAILAWCCSPAAEWKWLSFHRRRWRARCFLVGKVS